MPAKYSNAAAVPLSVAVWLATDTYDYQDDPNHISATALIKPIRQTILAARVPPVDAVVDIQNMINSRMGSAIHDAIERSWKTNHIQAMIDLGYPNGLAKRVLINPEAKDLTEDCIPIYLEQRAFRKIGKYTISGKWDFVGEGRVEDFKTTSTFTYTNQLNSEKYIMQGSIYRWIDPEKITSDEMAIQFLFTDWSKARAMSEPNYPKQRHQQQIFHLKSELETQVWIERRLALFEQYKDAPEDTIPWCDDEDLWRSEPVFKYYKNPDKTKRSTKNFETRSEAMLRLVEDGSVGIVKEVPGQVTACKYCPAFSACSQKDALIASGDLIMA